MKRQSCFLYQALLVSTLCFGLVKPVLSFTEQELFSSPVQGETVSAHFQFVIESLSTVRFVRADYSETKKMKLLSHPLQSNGKIIFSPTQGLYRKMEKPFSMEILINQQEFVQRDSIGDINRVHIKSVAPAKAFINFFVSLLGGDQKYWKTHFDVYFLGTHENWWIGFLTKRESPIARHLSRVILQGEGAQFNVVTLVEQNGDRTVTTYSQQHIKTNGEVEFPDAETFPSF
ncbi:MAG: outer membrane lipoprotein carrier protein LolA [Elusimicrobia bacterium]|jgi:hypothetical protein|nr:outer membrane lipoprotein carrier protein LolA [Elusimicrobiota bacterium]